MTTAPQAPMADQREGREDAAGNLPPLEEIVANFEFLDDWEDRYRYLIELGRELPPFPEQHRDEAHKVRGCASQVWLATSTLGNGNAGGEADAGETAQGHAGAGLTLRVRADSDAHIVRGLVALALASFDGRRADEIAGFDMGAVLARIGLDEHLTPQRANGFASLVARIKDAARAAATG